MCGKKQPVNWRISWDRPKDKTNPMGRLETITASEAQRKCDASALDLVINFDGLNPLAQTLYRGLEPHWVAGASLRADEQLLLTWGIATVVKQTLAVVDYDTNCVGASPIRVWQSQSPVVQRDIITASCKLCSDNRLHYNGCIAVKHYYIICDRANQVINWLGRKLG
ncbi:MAG: hypothetical protein CL831_10705 [Crocinitomicaceae bacterium]|nr:hypothetical protein [Crocinitomicaceae bacterium]